MKLLSTFLFLACSPFSHADGLPYSPDGELYIDSGIILMMDTEQFKEVDTQRLITLHDDQKYLLKKLFKKVPDKLTVVSSAFNDNREDAEAYEAHCIWLRDRILVVTYGVGSNEIARKGYEENMHIVSVADPKRLVISSEAKVYREGKELSLADVFRLIDGLSKTPASPNESKKDTHVTPSQNRLILDQAETSLSFSLPPKVAGVTTEDMSPESLLQALQIYGVTKNVQVQATW